MSRRTLVIAICAAIASVHAGLAFAVPEPRPVVTRDPGEVRQLRVSLDDAVEIAQRRVPGRVVGAATKSYRDRFVHEVKILTESGTVRIVRIDAESGRVLR